jgi:hypothetical protein
MIDVKDLVFDEKSTKEFTDKNLDVLVFQNSKTGKKLYLKPVKKDGEFINLSPLSKSELEEIGIIEESLSETINGSELFDLDIQESVSDVVEPIGKKTTFNVHDPKDMAIARNIADRMLEKQGQPQTQEPDNSGIEAAKEVFEDIKENLSVELTALGVDTSPSDLKSKTDLDRAVSTVKKMRELKESAKPQNPNAGSGTVPFNTQTPARQKSEGYNSIEAMIDDANQNKDVRNKLLHKVLVGVRDGKLSLPSYQEPEQETTTSDLSEDLRLAVKPDVMGIQHAYRKKKLIALAEKGDAQALEILNNGNY